MTSPYPNPPETGAQLGEDEPSAGSTVASRTTASEAIPSSETDDRRPGEWKTRYPAEARLAIRWETAYVVSVLFGSLGSLLLIWNGTYFELFGCDECSRGVFRKYAYFFVAGVMGGSLFGAKFLYHVVAKGYWNEDRRLWRLLSPILAGTLSLGIGTLIDAGFLGLAVQSRSAATYVSIGFITGYFGDKALAKMTEMADVLFGVGASKRDTGEQGSEKSTRDR